MKNYLSRLAMSAIGLACALGANPVWGENELFPESIQDLSSFQLGNADYDFAITKFRIEINLLCYRVNVRHEQNGLNTYSNLLVTIPIKNRTTGGLFKVEFPAGMFFGRPPGAFVARVVGVNPPSTKLGFDFKTRTLLIETPRAANNETLDTPRFYQVVYSPTGAPQNTNLQVLSSGGQPFLFPSTEPSSDLQTRTTYVTHSITQQRGSDGLFLKVTASFPGALNHCGSYKSPLMLFFDERFPNFSGTAEILASENGGNPTYWVEPGASGYFLAMDRDGDRSITKSEELFAGFEKLRPFDSNQDGYVDANDKDFRKLVLWNDADGNGLSSPRELSSLGKLGVRRLDLKADRRTRNFGHHAWGDGFSSFSFWESKEQKLATGQLIDIWFEGK